MDTILFILNLGPMDNEKKELLNTFKSNINKLLIKIPNDDDKTLLHNCHTLKGYFSNIEIQTLLKNNQDPNVIRKNFDYIKELILKEITKLNKYK